MTRKSLKSGKSSRQKQSSEDIGNSEAGLVEQQAAQAQAEELAAPDAGQEAELESDAEPEPEAPTLTELIISKFAGDKVNGQFEGFGFMEFANGNLYEGEFYHGTMHGKGKYTWTATGMVYEGDFYCNQITGVGKYTWDDGSSYDGQVVQGVRHGVGVYTHPSGLSYDGQWHMGMKQGQGKLSYSADGSSYYEGQWLADRPHGEGVRRYPSGNVYQGMWYAGLRHGQGTMRWADKDETYTGQWEDGVQHGVGQHTWYLKRAPNSQYMLRNIYEGDFFKGRRHGYGVFYYPSGSRYEGQWANDMKCGHGKFIFKNGRVFEGQFKDDRMVEFPSCRTTPDHVSIRTRSPLPGEVHSVHSNASVNTLSPGFQLGLDHIFLAGELFDCDLEEETGQASFVAIHYLDKLRRIYNYYATLGTGELEDNANVLTMLQFWRLMKDCRFINDDWTLAKFNRLLVSNYDPLTPETAHNPYKEVVFLDFLNHLVTIAYHLYGTSMKCEKGLLASCFTKLIKERLLPNACSVRGRLFQDSRRGQHAAAAYAKPLWPVFQQQCQCERGLPTRSRLGLRGASASGGRSQSTGRNAGQGQQGCYPPREWVLSVRQFLRMLHVRHTDIQTDIQTA
uniref:Radial spoke head 10 homolog B n=1 Tax=Macrostomum lignano TaxID=282301 RepID=A0A1I8JBR1_9PLAT